MAHSPMDHVADEVGRYTIFTDLFGGYSIPLLDLRPHGIPFTLTKFMVLELVAAALVMVIFIPLARRAARSDYPRGAFWNAFEALLTFIRDQVAKPTLAGHDTGHHHDNPHDSTPHDGPGDHPGDAEKMAPSLHAPQPERHHDLDEIDDADRYVPFLWTVFLFILFCNLLGMVPFFGSPTGSIWVTGALALCSFVLLHGAAIAKMGFGNYVKALWPAADIPYGMGFVLKPMIFAIEVLGTVIKSGVLAVRLFANIMAGHLVLGYIMAFIVIANDVAYFNEVGWAGITLASLLGTTALSLLELFVAFLQAYIFTFLTALFMGMQMNPSH